MDVRGCTKGNGGGRGGGEEGQREGDAIVVIAEYARFWKGQSENEEEKDGRSGEGGHNTTTIRHDNGQKQRTTSTEHTKKIIEYTKNTQTPPWAQ